uniref:Uncharacterized protein n=1 Tax=Graphocephala atropunctata TaxID=36148 RepID=A0A1B6M716_9HEMI
MPPLSYPTNIYKLVSRRICTTNITNKKCQDRLKKKKSSNSCCKESKVCDSSKNKPSKPEKCEPDIPAMSKPSKPQKCEPDIPPFCSKETAMECIQRLKEVQRAWGQVAHESQKNLEIY